MMDELSLGLLVVVLVVAPLGAWSAVREAAEPSQGSRIARYMLNVVAVVAGFGLGQAVSARLPAWLPPALAEGWADHWASFGMLAMLACAFLGAFAAMALVQAVEAPLRHRRGLPGQPYRLVRFDLLRW